MKSESLGLSTIVLVIFVTLKLLEVQPVADWSWWWVLSPIWISFALAFFVALILALIVNRSSKK
jgi:small Trp-rich protein